MLATATILAPGTKCLKSENKESRMGNWGEGVQKKRKKRKGVTVRCR